MKKSRLLVLLLCFILCFAMVLSSCSPAKPSDKTEADKTKEAEVKETVKALNGTYELDGTPYGMPMTWYINIDNAGNFKISTNREFTTDKGNGKVTESNGTYVFLYSDSTNDAPKTAEFTVVNGNLVFSTRVPVGTAGVKENEETGSGPVIAQIIAFEDKLGEYVGSYTKESAMGGSITYDYSLILGSGKSYKFTSSFTMGMAEYAYAEEGSFDIVGTTFKLTALKEVTSANIETGELTAIENPTTVEGTFENDTIQISLKASPMGSARYDSTLVKATTASVAGSHTAVKENPAPNYLITAYLDLDKVGNYSYVCHFISGMMGNADYYENGTFELTQNGIKLTPVEKSEDDTEYVTIEEPTVVEGKLNALSITLKMPTGGMPTELTFYHETANGFFESSDEGEEANYDVYLSLNPTGNYYMSVKDKETNIVFEAEGPFTVTYTTYNQLALTYDDGAGTLLGVIAPDSIQIQNIPVDNEGTTENFKLTRVLFK